MLREARRWVRVPAVCCAALALGAGAAVAVASPASADEVRSAQMWVLNAINAPTAWRATEGRGVVVAVIDSGVDPAVSDLTGSVIAGPDLAGVTTSPSNAGWGVHGTWMASLISGHGHAAGGGSGVMGVAPMSKVLSIRVVTDKTDPGYNRYQQESDSRVQRSLASAIGYATAHGASVISMSLGYGSPSAVVRSALQKALGIIVMTERDRPEVRAECVRMTRVLLPAQLCFFAGGLASLAQPEPALSRLLSIIGLIIDIAIIVMLAQHQSDEYFRRRV